MKVKHIHFPTIDSTNQWVKENLSELDKKDLTIVTADHQSKGRGRFNRPWLSPKGQNLYASFHLYGEYNPLSMAIAITEVLEDNGFKPLIKWPNDILIDNKKVAGILTEKVGKHIIIGIGLNVNMNRDLLEQIDKPATSLSDVSHQEWSIKKILSQLQSQFIKNLNKKKSIKRAAYLGEKVIFDDGKKTWEGIFYSWNEDGSISLKLNDKLNTFYSGEIIC